MVATISCGNTHYIIEYHNQVAMDSRDTEDCKDKGTEDTDTGDTRLKINNDYLYNQHSSTLTERSFVSRKQTNRYWNNL